MGYLFENMDKMDIQWERKKTAEARKELQDALEQLNIAKADADAAKADADAAKAARDNAEAIKQQLAADYIELLQQFLPDRQNAKQHILEKFALKEAEAEKMLALYWK